MSFSDDFQSPRLPKAQRQQAKLAFWIAGLIITSVALLPGNAGVQTLLGWDKLDHLLAFFALTLLARLAWPLVSKVWLSLMLMSYGVLLEIMQTMPFVGRSADVVDIVADGIGLGLGLLLAPVLVRILRLFLK